MQRGDQGGTADDAATTVSDGKKAKEQDLGRLFGDDGDMMDEHERREKEKSALEILQEQAKKKELKPVDHSKIDYKPFRKKLYIVPRALANLSEKEIAAQREDLEIKVRGKGIMSITLCCLFECVHVICPPAYHCDHLL